MKARFRISGNREYCKVLKNDENIVTYVSNLSIQVLKNTTSGFHNKVNRKRFLERYEKWVEK